MAKLSAAADESLRIENQFLTGVQANIEAQKGRQLRGDAWETVADDDSDALRAMMAGKRMYDRELLKQLPHNRRVIVKGYESRFFFWRKQTGAAVVSALSPLGSLVDGADPPPIGLNELTEHMRSLKLNPKVRHVVGVCATSGFSEEVRAARHEYPNVSLVLVEPASTGGWRITAGDEVPDFVRRLFDPEDVEQKMDRVRGEVDRRRSDLLTGGLSSDAMAQTLDLPREIVDATLERIAADDAELRLSKSSGDRLLYRGAPSLRKEKPTMSFVERIKEMFAKDGDEARKINVLSERRAALAQRRDRLYEEIGKLEGREAELLNQGRSNKSPVVRRRLAAQVAQLRKDIARQNTTANMLNQQINIIATDIHNLTLIQQGELASLPDTQELTENAVRAEEMLETLKGDADLVESLETGIGDVLTSDAEIDIMAEFDEALETPAAKADASTATTSTAPTATAPAAPVEAPESRITAEFDEPTTPRVEPKKADPEAI